MLIKIKETVDFLTEDDVWNERRNVLNKFEYNNNNASLFDFYHQTFCPNKYFKSCSDS